LDFENDQRLDLALRRNYNKFPALSHVRNIDYDCYYSRVWRDYNVCGDYKVCKNWLIFELFASRIEHLLSTTKKSGGIGIWTQFSVFLATLPENHNSN
jgi:hypothetical protein